MRSKIVTNANPTQEPEVSNVPSVLQRKVNRAAAAVNVNCSLGGCMHLGKRRPCYLLLIANTLSSFQLQPSLLNEARSGPGF